MEQVQIGSGAAVVPRVGPATVPTNGSGCATSDRATAPKSSPNTWRAISAKPTLPRKAAKLPNAKPTKSNAVEARPATQVSAPLSPTCKASDLAAPTGPRTTAATPARPDGALRPSQLDQLHAAVTADIDRRVVEQADSLADQLLPIVIDYRAALGSKGMSAAMDCFCEQGVIDVGQRQSMQRVLYNRLRKVGAENAEIMNKENEIELPAPMKATKQKLAKMAKSRPTTSATANS